MCTPRADSTTDFARRAPVAATSLPPQHLAGSRPGSSRSSTRLRQWVQGGQTVAAATERSERKSRRTTKRCSLPRLRPVKQQRSLAMRQTMFVRLRSRRLLQAYRGENAGYSAAANSPSRQSDSSADRETAQDCLQPVRFLERVVGGQRVGFGIRDPISGRSSGTPRRRQRPTRTC